MAGKMRIEGDGRTCYKYKNPSRTLEGFKYYKAFELLIIPVVTAAAATTVEATFLVATTAAATAEASFLEATAAATLWFRLSFVHDDLPAENFALIQTGQRVLGFSVFRHFNKTKAFATATYFVFYDLRGSNGAILFKQGSQILIGHLPGEVSYINVHCN